MKIDIFTHVMLPRYKQALYKYADKFPTEKAVQDRRPVLWDNEARLAKLEPYDDLVQVLSATMPPVEEVVGAQEAAELARICNDEIAEMVAGNPKRYIAAIANVPLNNTDIAMKEAERAITQLGFKGIQIHTRVNGQPPSTEAMMPLYQLMVDFDLPIWIHPMRSYGQPDWARKRSLTTSCSPYSAGPTTPLRHGEARLRGHLREIPYHQVHHPPPGGHGPLFFRQGRCPLEQRPPAPRGGPFPGPHASSHRVSEDVLCRYRAQRQQQLLHGMRPRVFRGGSSPLRHRHALRRGEWGVSLRETIKGIEKMGLPEATKQKIYEGNARRLLHL